jgi:hypothetical protein
MEKPNDLYVRPFAELSADDLNIISHYALLSGDPEALIPSGGRLVSLRDYRIARGLESAPEPAVKPDSGSEPESVTAPDLVEESESAISSQPATQPMESKLWKPTPGTRPGK